MNDTKENPPKSGGKFGDLLEDLQDTLENSIYNSDTEKAKDKKRVSKKTGDSVSDFGFGYESEHSETAKKSHGKSDAVSEIFDALNDTVPESRPKKQDRRPESPEKIRRTESPNNTNKSDRTDKAEISEDKKLKPKEPKKPGNIRGTNAADKNAEHNTERIEEKKFEIQEEYIDNINISKDKNNDTIDIMNMNDTDGIDDIDDIDNIDNINTADGSDMDLELLKAIGIGKTNIGFEDDLQPDIPETIFTGKSRENKTRKARPDSKKAPVKPSRIYNKISDKEYTDREQMNEIFASYKKSYISELIKLLLGALLFLMLLYMEIAPYIKWPLPEFLNINYVHMPYIWVDLQLLLLVAALNLKSLSYGMKSMFAANINVYSISFFFFAVSFIHTVLTLFMRGGSIDSVSPNMVLYNSMGVFGMVLISLYNLLDMSSEITGFKTVTSKKPKYALDLILPDQYQKPSEPRRRTVSGKTERQYASAMLESELFKDVIPADASVGGITITPFVSNFFSRTYKEKHAGGLIKYYIYISAFMAVALFIVLMGISGDKSWYVALSSVTALILGSVPLCSFIITVYPVFMAQRKAASAGSAFIGGNSIEEISGIPIISLYDRDIFPSEQIKISGIKVYGNNRIDSVLQSLCVVFDRLNMAPADTFRASANFDKSLNRDVKIVNVADNGICYAADGKKLFLGTSEYISNMGLITNYDTNFDDQFLKSLGSIMFLASQSEVVAKIYIKYEITADFYDIIKNINKINACLCIRTFDPNIDDGLIMKLGNLKKYPIKVLKLKNPADIYAAPESMESPVISKESVKSLINAVLIADKTKRVMKSNVLIQAAVFAVSLLLSIILGFAGQLWGINSGHLFLLQSFWFLPVIIFTGISQ